MQREAMAFREPDLGGRNALCYGVDLPRRQREEIFLVYERLYTSCLFLYIQESRFLLVLINLVSIIPLYPVPPDCDINNVNLQ